VGSVRDSNGVCVVCGYPTDPCRCDDPVGKPHAERSEQRNVSIQVFISRSQYVSIIVGASRLDDGAFSEPTCRMVVVVNMTRAQTDLVASAVSKAWDEYAERWPS
jgi:hypothetical protein